MAKKPQRNANKSVSKKEFNLDSFLKSENLDSEPKDKDLTWIPLSKAFHDAIKLPGFPRGFVSLVRGYSNTGKSTAFYEAIAGAQKIGDLPVVIETEGNWNWGHAKMCGVKYIESLDKETGEITEKPDGFILVRSKDLFDRYKNYDHAESKMKAAPTRDEPVIEDVAFFMGDMIKKQNEGLIPKNMCFLWDSIGTLNCFKSAKSNSSNNMWNAGAMASSFQSICNFKIPSTRRVDSEFTNTFICVQKIWLDNMNGSVIKHKGGEAMFYSSRIIIHIGGILTHGTKKLKATALKQEFQYGIQAKIKCEKNHVTGIERSGEIASTPHGFINPEEIDEYKKTHRKFIHEALNVDYDTQIEYSMEDGIFEADDQSA
tara:strand:+ start:12805 stop:13920 length:1116 start_codon:yes stop_codon:yes gene_type:complete